MTKFKVGDIVVGNQDNEINGVEQGQLYEVIATELERGYDYIKTDLSVGGWVLSERFDLYKAAPYQEEQDDPLPPAPESVRYYTSPRKMNYLDIQVNPYGELCIAATSDRNTFYNYLDAEAALQLAHDLTRMAMEIKRKEKRQGRKTTLNPAIVHPYGE